jgi:hypothetical protein
VTGSSNGGSWSLFILAKTKTPGQRVKQIFPERVGIGLNSDGKDTFANRDENK